MVFKNCITLLSMTSLVCFSQGHISNVFSLKWETKVGVTTYRTNILESDGSIYIGSNGQNPNSSNDSLDGVHQINAKTGALEYLYQSPLLGDIDVTGIALDGNKLMFGTDNYYFYCFDKKTKEELWKFPTPYDVESVPALSDLNKDGVKDVVFAVENYGIYALDGKNGELLWRQDSITSHNGNVAPLLVDCNNDGVLDVVTGVRGGRNSDEILGFVMSHYGDYHIAFNGKNGSILWVVEAGSGIHASPFLYQDIESEKKLICNIDAYGRMKIITLQGEVIKILNFGYDMFSSPLVYKNFLIQNHVVINIKEQFFEMGKNKNISYLKEETPIKEEELTGKYSATPIIADIMNLGNYQIIQVTESGEMVIKSIDGTLIKKLSFEGGAEASVMVKDVDSDGYLEVLISSLNGNLYCYDTKSKGKVYYGQFRWTNSNVSPLSN